MITVHEPYGYESCTCCKAYRADGKGMKSINFFTNSEHTNSIVITLCEDCLNELKGKLKDGTK